VQQNAAKFTLEIHSKLYTESRVKNKVIWHNIRPHRRRTWTAQSCSPGGANVHPICTVPVLPPAELLELYWLLDMSWARHFSLNISLHDSLGPSESKQEGLHPLTGQRAANFRLLASQWAERRLVTQWCHGCRAMRWSVCNAGASNAGRSLCVQISRNLSYPLPIYWYHSKGNWFCYNFAADTSYHSRKIP